MSIVTDDQLVRVYTQGYKRALEAAIHLIDHTLAELSAKGDVPAPEALRILRESYVAMGGDFE